MYDGSVGFVGCGQMARALAKGFVQANVIAEHQVLGFDPLSAAGEGFQQLMPKSKLCPSNQELVEQADLIILAVKPQVAAAAMAEMQPISNKQLIVSIVAGLSLAKLSEALGTKRIIRVMPNTPCLVQQGAMGCSVGSEISEADTELVQGLLQSVGLVVEVSENQLDAVTGLSGSGPAFIFTVIDALSDGGVRMGLARDVATKLAAQTVLGSAALLLETGEHPGQLKDRVTSPGGWASRDWPSPARAPSWS